MANKHPSDEALFDGDRAALDHARACDDCRRRAARMTAGAALVQRSRKLSQPELDWGKLDAFAAHAAERAASEVRAGKLRAPSRAPRYLAWSGGALALAAAAVLALRVSPRTPADPQSQRSTTMISSQRLQSGGEAPVPTTDAWSEARVLVAAGPVDHVQRDGVRGALTARSRVRPGDRVQGRAPSARVLLASAPGQRLDARGESELRLASMESGSSSAELMRGEARVDVAAGASKLTLDALEWRVVSKRGAFIAKIEGESVRLRVLQGSVDVAHRGGAPTVIASGHEVLLHKGGRSSDEGSSARGTDDDLAIDERALGLGEDGELLTVAPPVEGAALSIDDAGVPRGAHVLRLRRAARLVARLGDAEWSRELDPRRAGEAEPPWVVVRAASAPSVAMAAPRAEPRARTTRAQAPTVLTAQTIPSEAMVGFRAVQRALGQRARHCFDACERTSTCGDSSNIAPIVDFDESGRVASVRLEGGASSTLAACIEREVRALRLPLLSNQRVNLGRFAR
jgi:hypothetical protein